MQHAFDSGIHSLPFLLTIVVVGAGGVGCSEGTLPSKKGVSGGSETGGPPPDRGDAGPVTSEPDGDRTPIGDAGADSSTGPTRPEVQTFTGCGAGGVSSKGGMRAIQCYGPWDLSGREIQTEGIRWQPGSFRVISPRRSK